MATLHDILPFGAFFQAPVSSLFSPPAAVDLVQPVENAILRLAGLTTFKKQSFKDSAPSARVAGVFHVIVTDGTRADWAKALGAKPAQVPLGVLVDAKGLPFRATSSIAELYDGDDTVDGEGLADAIDELPSYIPRGGKAKAAKAPAMRIDLGMIGR